MALVLTVAAAAVHGRRSGATMQVLSFAGFAAGIGAGAAVAPIVAGWAGGGRLSSFTALGVLLGCAGALGAVGRHMGSVAARAVRGSWMAKPDAGAGALVSAGAALGVSWLVAGMVFAVPAPLIDAQVHGSAVLGALDQVLPQPPRVFAAFQRVLSVTGISRSLIERGSYQAKAVALLGPLQLQAVVAKAGPSTVKVLGVGCGQVQEGSGFAIGRDLVVTNAHVVAGLAHPRVEYSVAGGRPASEPARVLYFNPRFDLALLGVRNLPGTPLVLDPYPVAPGTRAAVLGFPGGGPFHAVGAGVVREFYAIGHNIYGRGFTDRPVYQIDANVQPGNSGGPLVTAGGEVIGIVFSKSTVQRSVGYALSSPQVLSYVTAARSHLSPVGTGRCGG